MSVELSVPQWLRHATVPYVPSVGLVRPDAFEPSLKDVIGATASRAGAFFPYDGDARWCARKNEYILTEHVCQGSGWTIVPTLREEAERRLIKIHCYGGGMTETGALSRLKVDLLREYPGAMLQEVSFGKTRRGAKGDSCAFLLPCEQRNWHESPYRVRSLDDEASSVQKTLAELAEDDPECSGFMFLRNRRLQGADDGEIMVVVDDGGHSILGAVGPLAAGRDAAGFPMLFPPYFGVRKSFRRQGIGRVLWQEAMRRARQKGVTSIVLQAACGSAAESFYRRQGARELGFVCRG